MSDAPPPPGTPPPPPGDPQPQVIYVQQEKKKGGCLKFGAIGAAVLVVLIIIAAIASGGGDDTDNADSNGDSNGAPEVDSGLGSDDATKDVEITKCGVDELGFAEAVLKITNNSSKPSDYSIDVVFESEDGSQRLGDGFLYLEALQPDQSAEEKAASLDEIDGDFKCRLDTVQRTAS